jgi:hypothetical protein
MLPRGAAMQRYEREIVLGLVFFGVFVVLYYIFSFLQGT